MDFFEISNYVGSFFFTDVNKQYLWLYYLIGGLIFAVLYAFQSVALYTIAKRGGFKHRWFAFVPVLNTYYIGELARDNKIMNAKAKYFSLAAALVEAVYLGFAITHAIAEFLLFDGGYPVPEYSPYAYANMEWSYVTGYDLSGVPQYLNWAKTVYVVFAVVINVLSLASTVLMVFVTIAFFQTYSCDRHLLFSIICIFFPVRGLFMFAVRKNNGVNYRRYLQEKQRRQYEQYQEYLRRNSGGYGGSYYGTPPQSDPFNGLGKNGDGASSNDPFSDFGAGGAQSNGTGPASGQPPKSDDPFDDFN